MTNNILEELIKTFSKLPTLGQRSAKRMVLYLLNNKENMMKPLIKALQECYTQIKKCDNCGNFSTEEICDICRNTTRNEEIICIVETVADLWAIENSMVYKGYYHVLNGYLSAIEGKGPESLNIKSLLKRVKNNKKIKEIIIASNPTIEGQTTAHYIAELLKDYNIKITRPAYGIPIGSEFNFLDNSTLGIAFKTRKEF
jgi:recombination protein RecR